MWGNNSGRASQAALTNSNSPGRPWGTTTPSGNSDAENGYNLAAGGNKTSARRQTICGMRRKVFFVVIFGGILIAVAAVAIGVGAGVAFQKASPSKKLSTLSTSSDISCPSANDSIVETSSDGDSSTKYFRVSCGIDYSVSDGATDLASENSTSMGRCVELCADRGECIGVTWEESGGACVLKQSVGTSADASGTILALKIAKPEKAG
ncbi:uncharacterized protein DNG_05433 [Cephalotrichum gorgonifer]|uniref:Apple domain-containing protein n=1 Tax=Cephalotrichum gorgonifer TaxID=2041049 RepID=A0AAE8SVI5_9PEZI|nr:uncharacterized protein DNG_05433 [Cephalotrichum gorgonifer]